ncbi:hypothetical protein [Nocardioides sp.]|uniref:hypothetical protein n=1 Tax=Nocardioides sp. TaxID=35761 RepID=UPI00271C63A8|nr:hypothetical protein [Nocardioides sp.]MDO9454675.1 hypothetical protein [Nocardioides sp.]
MKPESHTRRVAVAFTAALAVLVTALVLPSSAGTETASLREVNEQLKAAAGVPHVDPPGTPFHTHDPRFKNKLARSGETGEETRDPTTAVQARTSAAYVASERKLPDPRLTTVPAMQTRTLVPQDRYAMAGGCYTLSPAAGRFVRRTGDTVKVATGRPFVGTRFRFQATRLGTYLLFSRGKVFLAGSNGLAVDRTPSTASEWTVQQTGKGAGRRFTFRLPDGRSLQVSGTSMSLGSRPTPFSLRRVGPCLAYPESQVDITGDPHAGVTPFQEVRGYVDAHTHGMAFEFLGGRAHCGRPWHKYGVAYALVDCPDHAVTGGNGALLETFLSGKPSHDPVGWPTFKDWPAPDSLTHEGTYYRWMERAWRGGERLFVNLLVENNKLCEIYPLKKNSCDDMDSIRLQARDMYAFQNYIDAQFGGPGKGFYRIVKTPFEARRVINQGKLAVVMGIETSVPFGCTFKAVAGTDVPACTAADITRQIGEMHRLGVRQMELVNKFDNALGGIAGDNGTTGVIVNAANFLETGTFWDMKTCTPSTTEDSDHTQYALPGGTPVEPAQDAIFGAIGTLFGGVLPAVPLYPPPNHCNTRGLTSLGAHTIRELVKRDMLFDPDHLSVKARSAAMDEIERLRYPGVLSSHSWSTPDAYTRIYKAGGFVTPYAGDSTGFVDKWRRHVGWADPRYYFGMGFGADINGLGAQGDPRGAGVRNKVTYPFRGINGVVVGKQHAGKRVYDINRDGVAQYGLYPDWIQDLTKVAGATRKADGAAILDDMTRGPEAYLQMWERATGIEPDSCRNPGLRKPVAQVKRLLRRGLTTTQVMTKVGQPFRRLGNTYGICAKAPGKPKVMVTITFSGKGRVTRVA